ncbi:MAG: VWA domain-containing protein, partial [Myxococcota bacterium]|nr:VWA domain-containing protein [Myxococcota bacterium]
MSDFRFADPQWAHALWAVIVFAVALFALERRGAERFEGLVASALQARLVDGPSSLQRHARNAFLVLACVFGVFALMRPQWGFEYIESPRASAELMVAIDVSRSMLAEDVAPNRLERAKSEIRDLLDYLHGDQVGLIAFAGRASVLAPMTPDFGFFRLVLDTLGPNSVGRGGTRLEEPIRKAIAGFRASGDISRVLVLITDGEDHDSFPLEAAKEAALRGIRIVAIGFGSESGSEIPITDRETGARTLLRDSNGDVVTTRLDGDTLREMALLTDGVYVPAGLGALDLESIYDKHIRNLMRAEIDSEGRVVRSEGFQWFVLLAMVCLLVSVAIGQRAPGRAAVPSFLVLLAVGLGSAPIAEAQPTSPPDATASAPTAPDEPMDDAIESPDFNAGADSEPELEAVDPREAYNSGLDAMELGALEVAEQHFEAARAAAATDGEARYRATYGLAYVAVAEADAALETNPETALDALYRAGDFFREAVRLQPANENPRHNLEIVLRRARVLADRLSQQDEKDIAAELDALIERQREVGAAVRLLLEHGATREAGPAADDAARVEFRRVSTEQRQLLSDADRFAERVDGERASLEAAPDEERAPEDAIRLVQLSQLEVFLSRARERMGHARRELRTRRGERAHRRANAALAELKRARDQLRDPVQVLDGLLRDAAELSRYTQATAVLGGGAAAPPGGAGPLGADAPDAPPWLTFDALREDQASVTERTEELDARLRAGLEQAANMPPPQPTSPEEASELDARLRMLAQVEAASPFIGEARGAFEEAGVGLDVDDARRAAIEQLRALAALAEARERFLDLRRLIELAHADQQRLQQVLDPEDEETARALEASRSELLPSLREAQGRNFGRVARLGELIEQERAALPDEETIAAMGEDEATAPGSAPDPAGVAAERERYELAEQILLVTASSMEGVVSGLGDETTTDWQPAVVAGAQAVRGLESLRRLFFSVIELLRDTAQRQLELADDTDEVAALEVDDQERRLAPLDPRQRELAEITGQIANALEEQSRAQPGNLVTGADPSASPDEQKQAQQAEQLRRAAELVLEAQIEMEGSSEGLAERPVPFERTREHQGVAVERLREALELLSPPPEEQQGDEQQEQQQG